VVCTSGQPGQPAAHKALRLVAAPAAPERRSPKSQALGHWCRMSMARRWEPTAVALSCQTAEGGAVSAGGGTGGLVTSAGGAGGASGGAWGGAGGGE